MSRKPQIRTRRGIILGDTVISKQKILHDANGKQVSINTCYPGGITIPILGLLVGGVFTITGDRWIGIGIAILSCILWVYSRKKIMDDPERIQGPTNISRQTDSESIPKGAIAEVGVPGWYWKWIT